MVLIQLNAHSLDIAPRRDAIRYAQLYVCKLNLRFYCKILFTIQRTHCKLFFLSLVKAALGVLRSNFLSFRKFVTIKSKIFPKNSVKVSKFSNEKEEPRSKVVWKPKSKLASSFGKGRPRKRCAKHTPLPKTQFYCVYCSGTDNLAGCSALDTKLNNEKPLVYSN